MATLCHVVPGKATALRPAGSPRKPLLPWQVRYYQIIGTKVRAARQRAGLTVADLAAQAHRHDPLLSAVALVNHEKGRNKITVDRLAALARVLQVPVTALLPGSDSEAA